MAYFVSAPRAVQRGQMVYPQLTFVQISMQVPVSNLAA